ncbi:MAG: hypothetical protein HY894_04630 [Deltaproteobacteria bacterium]|nr:hypothetical protein [Deltaproteobacteria bacterium]
MRGFLLKNLRLKLISLAFAFALWFFVAGQSSTELGIMAPLGYKGIPKDMVMTSAPFGEVEVRVTGPRFLVNNLESSRIIAELDLSGAKEGTNNYRVPSKDVSVPMGVRVSRVVPGVVEVHMERLVEVELPVRVRFHGKAAPGFRITGVAVSPRTVTASVLAKDAPGLAGVYTKPVDVSGLDESASVSAALDAPEPEFMNISAYNVTVRITGTSER